MHPGSLLDARRAEAGSRLRGHSLAIVGPTGRATDNAARVLQLAGARVEPYDSLGELVAEGRTRSAAVRSLDAILFDVRTPDAGFCRELRHLAPRLAAIVLTDTLREGRRARILFDGMGKLRVLERPRPDYELLEVSFSAVAETRGLPSCDCIARAHVRGPDVAPPDPTRWGADLLRKRLAQVADACQLTDRETQVMRGSLLEICLLYTSPSPRDRTRSRMPSSA